MTPGFQENLLKYFFQDRNAKKFIRYVDETVFDLPIHVTLYDLLRQYVKEFSTTPSKTDFIEYLDKTVHKSKMPVTDEAFKAMLNNVAVLYSRSDSNPEFLRKEIINFAMKKRTRKLFEKGAELIPNAEDEDFEKLYAEMGKILRLGRNSDATEKNDGGFFFKDRKKHFDDDAIQGMPVMLKALNRMTNAKGFYSPQSIVFVGGAKRFKTGLLLNLSLELAMNGLNVFYCDTENGITNLRARMKQVVLNCKRSDINLYRKQFNSIGQRVELMQGDIVPYFFPPGSTLNDVELAIDGYVQEHGWVPHVIVHDYGHNYEPTDTTLRIRKDKITNIYKEMPRLNQKYGAWSMGVVPIASDATDKWVLDEKDYADDKSLAYIVHAAFAINRIKFELKNGTARITPIQQRDGIGYRDDAFTTCAIRITEDCMQIEELDSEGYLATIEEEKVKLLGKTIHTASKPKKFPLKVTDK